MDPCPRRHSTAGPPRGSAGCGTTSRRWASTARAAATTGSPGPARTTTCGSGSPASAPSAGSTSPPTGWATSGRGGATRMPRWRPVTPASSSARTSTRCPTAVPSTARSASSARSPRSTSCAHDGFAPARPVGVVNFADEEGARFGVACAGSRVITGALGADRARGLADTDGVTMAEAMRRAGRDPSTLGRDDETLARIGAFVELHVEQGRAPGRPRPLRRGRQRHLAARPLAGRRARRGQPRRHHRARRARGRDAGLGRHDHRGPSCRRGAGLPRHRRQGARRAGRGERHRQPGHRRGSTPAAPTPTPCCAWSTRCVTSSPTSTPWSPRSRGLRPPPSTRPWYGGWPPGSTACRCIGTGAGHDAGILANDGIRSAMLFVRNPTGVSHSPDEWARPRTAWTASRLWPTSSPTSPGMVHDDVLVRARGAPRRCAALGAGRHRPRPDHRRAPRRPRPSPATPGSTAWCCPAWPTATATRSTEPCGGAPTTTAATSGRGATRCTPSRTASTRRRYHALARAVFAEMLLAGYTAVGEFHYVHHAAGGRRYDDPNVMGKALISAAREVGIRITLLDTCYLAGGLFASGHVPLDEVQERFSDGTVEAWADRVARLSDDETVRIGAAVHSVRAVPCDDLAVVGDVAARDDRPLHVHLSEQPAENLACEGFYGCTPTELLAGEGLLGRAHDRGARHPPVRQATSSCSGRRGRRPASARPPNVTSPTASARPGASSTRGCGCPSAPTSTPSSTPSRRCAASRCTSGSRACERGRFAGADLLGMAARNGYRSLGWDDGGRHRHRAPGRPGGRSPRQPTHRRRRPRWRALRGDRGRRHRRRRRGRTGGVRRQAPGRRRRPPAH